MTNEYRFNNLFSHSAVVCMVLFGYGRRDG
jgi:hypothetical protein